MTSRQLAPALRHVCRFLARPDAEGVTDAQLLQRFVNSRDETAFELLVWRHGPMALGVCRRILHNPHDAEDAFQATLLALACKARSIGKGGSVGSWLYKVAYRVALRVRAQSLRRVRHEKQVAELPAVADPRATDPAWRELGPVLDEELNRLPEKYRAAVVLCYLEGLTNEEAARQLRWPPGTIKTRLARARELLSSRLTHRGLVLGAGLVTTASVSVAMPLRAAMVSVTVRTAVLVIAGNGTAAGVVPAQVARLTEGVLRTMTMVKVKLVAAVLAAGLAVAGAGALSYQGLAGEPVPDKGSEAAARVAQLKKQIAGLQEELRQTEQEAAREKAAGEQRSQPLAVIFGDVPITREQLADHLLARLSADRLQAFINQRIIEHACRQKGIVVTDAEVEAAWKDDLANVGGAEKDLHAVLGKYQKSLTEWKEDVIRPRLLMTKVCRQGVRVTEQDLRNAFEANYGEKVECQLILWPREQKEKAAQDYEAIRKDEARFELAAGIQSNPTLAATSGRIKPFGRHGAQDEELEKAAFRLREGEISPLLDTPEGIVVVKCLKRIPADTSRAFEDVREELKQEALGHFLEKEIPKAFEELKEKARPRVLWQPKGS
jgi:RNA polymerase sigma factor (sigma-70 family)